MLQFEIRQLKEEKIISVLNIPQIETAEEWNAVARKHNAVYKAERQHEQKEDEAVFPSV